MEEKREINLVQVRIRETNESEPFEDASIAIGVVKTRGGPYHWD